MSLMPQSVLICAVVDAIRGRNAAATRSIMRRPPCRVMRRAVHEDAQRPRLKLKINQSKVWAAWLICESVH